VASHWWSDDDQLLALLDEALRAARAVPAEFVAAGKAAHAWQGIDAEPAALIHDSGLEHSGLEHSRLEHSRLEETAVRSAATAALRTLTFASSALTIEVELGPGILSGQVVPSEGGTVVARLAAGQAVVVDIDHVGCFVFRPTPTGRFRLQCRTVSGVCALTSWITPRAED
jgi:hypothetical protein